MPDRQEMGRKPNEEQLHISLASPLVPGMTIRRVVNAFLDDTGMPYSRFGRNVAKDPNLVRDINLGRVPRASLDSRIRKYVRNYYANISR